MDHDGMMRMQLPLLLRLEKMPDPSAFIVAELGRHQGRRAVREALKKEFLRAVTCKNYPAC
jgi:hypothetical protein